MPVSDVVLEGRDLDVLKARLRTVLPKVKSSHRCQAMARGFGWRTYEAMRAELASSAVVRPVNDDSFRAYLAEHGFDVAEKLSEVLESIWPF